MTAEQAKTQIAKGKQEHDKEEAPLPRGQKQKFLPTGLSRAIVLTAFVWATVMLVDTVLADRYALVPAPNTDNSFMYRLDRLTGRIHFCGAQQCVPVQIKTD